MSPTPPLFEAMLGDNPIVVARASQDELAPLAGTVENMAVRDRLDLWSLVVIRDRDGAQMQVHALGWARRQHSTCLTSALTRVGLARSAVATESGSAYQLGQPAGAEISRELLDHLDHVLRLQGVTDVRP